MTPPVETQPERTALAWQRTGLGVLAVAGLLGHSALRQEDPAALLLAAVAALLGLGVLGGLSPARDRGLRDRPMAAPRLVGLATAAVLVVGVLAGVAVLR
jgi:putative membrane protein